MSIEQRLSRLESSARRWRLLAVVLGLALLGVIGIAAAPAKDGVVDELRARSLVIVDPKGKADAGATIEARKDDVQIAMHSKGGTAGVLCAESGVIFTLTSPAADGKKVTVAISTDESGTSITATDQRGSDVFEMFGSNLGGRVRISDALGNTRWKIPE